MALDIHRRDGAIASPAGLRLSPETTTNATSGAEPAREQVGATHQRTNPTNIGRLASIRRSGASGSAFYRGPTLLQSRTDCPLQNQGLSNGC